MEELQVGRPWTVTKGDSNGSGKGDEAPVRWQKRLQLKKRKFGKLKEDELEVEMKVDAGVPQAESAEVKSPKRR